MSIATQITRIQNEVSSQADLISQIMAILSSKSIGAASVYTSSSAPTDDIGSDGDIYLVVSE